MFVQAVALDAFLASQVFNTVCLVVSTNGIEAGPPAIVSQGYLLRGAN